MSRHQLSRASCNLLMLFLFLFLFCACDGIKGKLLVMRANMQTSLMSTSLMSSRMQDTEAISTYSEALRYTEAVPYAEYGLGLVYLFLGEDKAAFSRFGNAEAIMDKALPHTDDELDFRIHYNRGILYFHAGRFDEAAFEFRNALEIDGSRIEAKRNLELSLLSIKQQSSSASSSKEIKNDKAEENTLFDYLRQKEADSWKAHELAENQNSPWLDY